MFTRVFCQHCDTYYEVCLDEARLVEQYYNEKITFKNNTYYFRSKECFFHLAKKLKKRTHLTPGSKQRNHHA